MSELHQNEISHTSNYECIYRDKMKLVLKEMKIKHKIKTSIGDQISDLINSKDNGYDYFCYYKNRLRSHPMVEKHFHRHKGIFKSKEQADFAIKHLRKKGDNWSHQVIKIEVMINILKDKLEYFGQNWNSIDEKMKSFHSFEIPFKFGKYVKKLNLE